MNAHRPTNKPKTKRCVMRQTRIAGVVVAVLALAVAASSAQAAAKVRKHKKEHAIEGVVKAVEKDKDGGKITVLVGEHHHHKKGGGATATAAAKPAVEKTVRVTADTKFTKVSGKKGAKEQTAGTFAELKDGDRVVIAALGDKAEEVKFHAGHHHKKGKKKAVAA